MFNLVSPIRSQPTSNRSQYTENLGWNALDENMRIRFIRYLALDDVQRQAHRMEYAKSILNAFKAWTENQVDAVLPKSPLGKALFEILNHCKALNRFLDEGFLKPDNNKTAQHIRPAALGRKSYLFVGSGRGGNATAIYKCRGH